MNDATHKPKAPSGKPRLALMGEFSAGKSTLSNLLLGADPLPVKVTATRLPPVWITYGDNSAMREDLDGNMIAIDISQLDNVQLEETHAIHLTLKAEILRLCDLIDMPGISDPNMAPEIWQAAIGEADHVIWCSHATQAWRQSEAAVWESLPERLREESLLLLTRFDKILSDRDRTRVLTRVRRETKGLFRELFPISLTEALAAADNRETWDHSGAEPFVKCLIDLLMNRESPTEEAETENRRASDAAVQPGTAKQVTSQATEIATENATENTTEHSSGIRIMPTRVRLKSGGQRRARAMAIPNPALLVDQPMAEMPGNV